MRGLLTLACLGAIGLAAGAQEPQAEISEAAFRHLAAYERGDARQALIELEGLADEAHGDEALRAALEQGFIEQLEAGLSPAAREFVCKQLSRVGTAKAAPVLSRLLEDPRTAHMARYALERIGGPEAEAALIAAMTKTEGSHRAGIIHSLGQLRCAAALQPAGELLGSDDDAEASAAAQTLAQIGGGQAGAMLLAAMQAKPSPHLAEALLVCAQRRLRSGEPSRALELVAPMLEEGAPHAYRGPALRVDVAANGKPMERLAELLVAEPPEVAGALMPLLREASKPGAAGPVLRRLGEMRPASLPAVFMALGLSQDPAALPFLRDWLAAADREGNTPEARAAAAWALGSYGGEGSAEALAQAAAEEDAAVANAARQALSKASSPRVNEAILRLLRTESARVRRELAQIAVERDLRRASPILLEGYGEEATEAAYGQALVALADHDDIAGLAQALDREAAAGSREVLEEALAEAARSVSSPAETVISALSRADTPSGQASLARVLGRLGDPEAPPQLAALAQHDSPMVRDAAIAALSSWPAIGAAGYLIDLLDTPLSAANRTVVTEGVARLVADPAAGSSQERLEAARGALKRTEELAHARTLLEALPGIGALEPLSLAEDYIDEPGLADTARAVMERIRRSAWRASASHMTQIAVNAIDEDPSSRWHTGTQQGGGEWFQLDLGAAYTVSGVTLVLAEEVREGYPREYEAYLSLKGEDWGRPAAQGAGTAGSVRIEVAPQKARYVRVVQTGRADGAYWAIDEIDVALE